ncbi:MAG: hypothetical protein V4580_12890 [Bacteroidota bacterium]
MSNIKNAILAGFAFGLLFGLFLFIQYAISYALIAGPVAGLAFGVAMYFFLTSKTVKQQTEISPEYGNTILYSGAANYFIGVEAVGGKLYLLKHNIIFKSHGFNMQNLEKHIAHTDINDITTFNTLGIIPNGLKLVLGNNVTEKFVVNNRKQWLTEIKQNMNLL